MSPAQVGGMLVGVWLVAAPALLSYAGEPAGDFHRVVGPLAAGVALIAAWDATRGLARALLIAGPALALAPVVVAHSAAAVANALACAALLAAAAPFGGTSGPLGGGWRALATGPSSSARQAERDGR
ncbi:MAG: hypothetical protein ACRDZ3_06145 [Acidimicrobiia bacterium]